MSVAAQLDVPLVACPGCGLLMDPVCSRRDRAHIDQCTALAERERRVAEAALEDVT